MRHRNALAGLLLATAASFGGKQAVATCEFVVPTNEWVVAAHATYACQTIIPGLLQMTTTLRSPGRGRPESRPSGMRNEK